MSLSEKIINRHGELIAELNDQSFNLAPPKSNMEMLVLDYDDVEEAVNLFHNYVLMVLDEYGRELAELLKNRPDKECKESACILNVNVSVPCHNTDCHLFWNIDDYIKKVQKKVAELNGETSPHNKEAK